MSQELDMLYEKLTEDFKGRRFANLRMTLLDMEEADIAYYIENNLDKAEQIAFFRILPKELASDIFIEFSSDLQEDLIKSFTDRELKTVLDDMFLDDTVDIIEEMPANVVKRLLKATDPEDRKSINKLLEYSDDSAGSIMTPEFVSLPSTMTVADAFAKIRRQGVNKETIYTCYVCDVKKKLLGVVTVKDLLLADMDDIVEHIMDTNVVSVGATEDKEHAARLLQKYDFIVLPVIDNEGCIVGIITVDDAIDVMQEEATEDIQKMAAISSNDKPYLKQSVFSIWRDRVVWLLILMLSATFTSLIIQRNENVLSGSIYGLMLMACVPMLMGTGGNAGGQASVTIIRGLAVNELQFKDIWKIIWKELRAALLISLTIAVVCFFKLLFIDGFYWNEGGIKVSAVVSIAMVATVVLAKIVGCTLPLFAKLLRLDPAVMASPLVTTIIDSLSLIIYCGLSVAILNI